MKRAIIYGRVSTRRQADDGLPIESQLDHCRSKASALGSVVLREFVDGGISGTTDKRPAFQDALNYCAVHQVDYFICWSSSRFARNHLDAGNYKGVLDGYGTRLVYSSTEVDIRTDDGWFMDAISAVIDERYSRQVASDTRRSMVKNARDGFFCGGRVPFGYAVVPDGKRRRLAPHPVEGRLVERIFNMALSGAMGAKAIAMQLNRDGLSQRGKPWAKNNVANLLENEVYMGMIVFNRTNHRTRKVNPPQDWVRVQSHEPLVSAEQFADAQQAIADRAPSRVGGTPRSMYVFAGLLKCGACGASLRLMNGTSRNGTRYDYYGCGAHLGGTKRCSFKNERAELFDQWMLGELVNMVLTPERMVGIIEKAKAQRLEWVQERDGRRIGLVKELREAEGARSKLFSLLEMHGQGAPNLGDLTPRLRELNARIKKVESALVTLEDEPISPGDLPDIAPEEAAAELRAVILGCADVKRLRAFVSEFVESIAVDGDQCTVAYKPDCVVRMAAGNPVRSDVLWLPDKSTLRTEKVVIRRVRQVA